jgi:phosphinothricin acetyltransferase
MHTRDATAADLPAINAIYNHFVLHCTCTYQVTPETDEARRVWFEGHGPRYPVIVAEEDGEVLGWGSLSRFHPREGYAGSAENSVYVSPSHHRRGIGRLLLEELIRRARAAGFHTIVAGVSAEQEASLGLHRRLGFTESGRLREVGLKFGRVLDVIYLQLMLE